MPALSVSTFSPLPMTLTIPEVIDTNTAVTARTVQDLDTR